MAVQREQEATPETADEFLEEGVKQEEYADRWILSDISKSLRAYQSAVEMYRHALKLDAGLNDALYNMLRLLFYVYETYKDVPSSALSSVESCSIHEWSIDRLVKEYELHGWVNWECAYNQVLIYMEVIEQEEITIDAIKHRLERSIQLIGDVLKVQMGELDAFLRRLEGCESDQGAKEEGEAVMYEQVVPSTVIDTLITAWRVLFTSIPPCDTISEVKEIHKGVQGFTNDLNKCFALLGKFIGGQDPYNIRIGETELDELVLVKLCFESTYYTDFDQLAALWNSQENQTSARWLAQSDVYSNLLSLVELTDEQKWKIVSNVLQSLKSAQDALSKELEAHKASKSAQQSSVVSKIIEVLISRADNELTRAKLDCSSALQHRETLKVNATNLLKSGLNYAQGNVGLREPALDRLHREKMKRECVIRLLLLTKETVTEGDLKRNLGDFALQEWEEIQKNPVYSS